MYNKKVTHEVKGELTLCFDSITDRAWVAQAVRIGCSHQEQVDGARLQTLQDETLCFHMIGEGLPAAPCCVAAVHTAQIKHKYLSSKSLRSKLT